VILLTSVEASTMIWYRSLCCSLSGAAKYRKDSPAIACSLSATWLDRRCPGGLA